MVGSGYSAITTVKLLADLAEEEAALPSSGGGEATEATAASARVVWATRRHGGGASSDGSGGSASGSGGSGAPLYVRVENDSLPERDALAALANAISSEGERAPSLSSVRHLGGAQLAAVRARRLVARCAACKKCSRAVSALAREL